jgi:hypothetical protein
MTTFEMLILSSPSGFQQGCIQLNKLITNDLPMFSNIIDLNYNYCHENTFKTLKFIYNSYKNSNPKPTPSSIANILDNKSFLSRECIEKIVEKIEQYELDNNVLQLSDIDKTKKSNRMINFKWKIGIAMASNNCNNLRSPYVKLSYDIRSPSGMLTPFSMELSIEQFKVNRLIIVIVNIFIINIYSILIITYIL